MDERERNSPFFNGLPGYALAYPTYLLLNLMAAILREGMQFATIYVTAGTEAHIPDK